MRCPASFTDGIDLFLLSVPHTGTRFTERLLGPLYKMHTDLGVERKRMPRLRLLLEMSRVIVSPLRDPQKVWASFCRRRHTGERFWEGWRILEVLHQEFKIHYLPVDTPDRQLYLDEIAKGLGRKIETDWEPIGNKDVTHGLLLDQDLTEVYAMPMIRDRYFLGAAA